MTIVSHSENKVRSNPHIEEGNKMKVSKQKFGMLSDGRKVNLYTVKNGNMSFSCTDYGCTITSIVLNDGENKRQMFCLVFPLLKVI
jgi:aldose 1-epimerase